MFNPADCLLEAILGIQSITYLTIEKRPEGLIEAGRIYAPLE